MIRKSVAEILDHHVTFELEAIDRMYLNAYVPSLQTGAGFVYFLKTQLGVRVPSTVMIAPMSQRFVDAIERFVQTEGVDLVTFKKGQRKDDVAQTYLAAFKEEEGILFIGKAQEKASVFRTEKRRDAQGKKYPWIIRSTAMPNHYYVYILDRDFGPLFIKFCTYFPYAAKVCLNGHEWLKRQLTRRGVAYEPLDNGIRSTEDAARVQAIAHQLDAAKIEAVVRTVEKIETAVEPRFQEHFVDAMALPHRTAPMPNLAAAVQLPARRGSADGNGGGEAGTGGPVGGSQHGRRVNRRRAIVAAKEER